MPRKPVPKREASVSAAETDVATSATSASRSSPGKWTGLIYFVISQIGWFACVLGAAHGVPSVGVAVTLAIVIWHLLRVPRPRYELKMLLAVIAIGGVWESALVDLGLLIYPNGILLPWTAPYWMLALWALFAITLNTTFNWLKGRPLLAAILGALSGPLSFSAGARLGAVQFHPPHLALLALAIGWAMLIPAVLAIANHWDGTRSS